jgi:hypothetical protein
MGPRTAKGRKAGKERETPRRGQLRVGWGMGRNKKGRTEDGIIEGSRGESEFLGLVTEGGDDLGVAVALVDGGVGTEHVDVLLPLRIPDFGSLGSLKAASGQEATWEGQGCQ